MNKKYILSRRDFLRSAVATGAAAAFPTIVPSTVFGATAPGNRITMGMVGMGLQMGGHLIGMLGRSEVQVLAVCDVDQERLQDAKNRVESAYADETTNGTYKGCDAYREYEKICERPDIDSVFVCTPDHWHAPVSLAAIEAMSKFCNVVAAESLFEIAANGSESDRTAAREGLALMTGPDIDENIKAKAASGDIKTRVVAIGLLGQRYIPGQVENLIEYATDNNEDISAAAFEALSYFGDSVDITTLIKLLSKTKSDKARNSGITSLKSILARTTDKDAAAEIIIKQMETAEKNFKLNLLSTLSAVGGPIALKNVVEAAQSNDETTRDTGIRTLSEWPDYEAAKILSDIASNPETSLTHHVIAIRGALRLIETDNSPPPDERTSLCINVFDITRRDEEKRLAISTMGMLPSLKMADKLLDVVKDDNFKSEAGLAAVQLATTMVWTNRQPAIKLAQKIRDMNISDEINIRADFVISSVGFRFRGPRRRR